ncbi:hypothetical protein SARC_01346 [Sphaeroforma arctica JP610]|uniref:Sugar phosphate transporter domain-containing protein n=1 Tax=Sphaeroforma arctica JP610 TaxID=667725 RepID=A0A0L0GC83_9EUKA|nr:hypothetical protein SARC_01346 [Sphaeroforma arctica JP610]KNC86516.1 hypothetical protein SARC_01346 [Sphaeroforma arctica JP610]|eukprot:XP_014160418.1 hypothetical protein SARC_01346 [Sphaeroforma arctica JP610]
MAAEPTKNEIVFAIVAYSLCSGTLLLLNKVVLHFIPLPALITLCQLVMAICIVYGIKTLKLAEVNEFDLEKLVPYAYYTIAFVSGIYANMRALQTCNVETVIVFRALTPLAVSFLDFACLGRESPSARSMISMISIVIGAAVYVSDDMEFAVEGTAAYTWVIIYFLAICAEMTYGKKLVSDVDLTLSGSVLYTNTLAILPFLFLFLSTSELSVLTTQAPVESWPFLGWVVLVASGVVGAGIGYSGWNCRHKVSATSFTIIGVINKFLTVMLNIIIWDKHASTISLCGLIICLVAGSFYRQAPLRELHSKGVSKA